jgi:hypothetical protein
MASRGVLCSTRESNQYWLAQEGDSIKSLLFLDRVAILLPDYMYG